MIYQSTLPVVYVLDSSCTACLQQAKEVQGLCCCCVESLFICICMVRGVFD